MKRIFLIMLATGLVLTGAAQSRAQEYIKKIPALPNDSCNVSRATVQNYVAGVKALRDQLMNEIEGIREAVDSHMESNADVTKEKMMKQMSQMYGLSQEDMDKMKNAKNMSAADKQALANKMIQQQANMTMDEAKNLSKMSDAGKQAYAEAYATEAMATAKNDPQQAERNNFAGNIIEAGAARQDAYQKIQEIDNRIKSFYSPIESDPERQKMLDRIDAWNKKLISMSGIHTESQSKIADSIVLRIRNEKIAYCNRYTPLCRAALRKHLLTVKASMPEYIKFGEINAETTKIQTGVETPAAVKELTSMEAVARYLEALEGVYAFNLYFPGEI